MGVAGDPAFRSCSWLTVIVYPQCCKCCCSSSSQDLLPCSLLRLYTHVKDIFRPLQTDPARVEKAVLLCLTQILIVSRPPWLARKAFGHDSTPILWRRARGSLPIATAALAGLNRLSRAVSNEDYKHSYCQGERKSSCQLGTRANGNVGRAIDRTLTNRDARQGKRT